MLSKRHVVWLCVLLLGLSDVGALLQQEARSRTSTRSQSRWGLLHRMHSWPDKPSGEDLSKIRTLAMQGFGTLDVDEDGFLTLRELSAQGIGGHLSAELAEDVIRLCENRADVLQLASSPSERTQRGCSLIDASSYVDEWLSSGQVEKDMQNLQRAIQLKDAFSEDPEDFGGKCGPADRNCRYLKTSCFKRDFAWAGLLTGGLCKKRTCVCDATPETKRLVKLGMSGALAVTTSWGLRPGDEAQMPQCGEGWQQTPIAVEMNVTQHDPITRAKMKMVGETLVPKGNPRVTLDIVMNEKTDRTEAILFKSASHQLKRGGPGEEVCMISWMPTHDADDWYTNLEMNLINFPYAPRRSGYKSQQGITDAYVSMREPLYKAFQRECCSSVSRAKKLIISGHSHGGAMAYLHAIDAVTNWRCAGEDLGADDIALVAIAPHPDTLTDHIVNSVFSCGDKSSCLAGSAVVLVTEGDYVASGNIAPGIEIPTVHASVVTHLPCSVVKTEHRFHSFINHNQWCHGFYQYAPAVEELLVDRAGWGSSCNGCANLEGALQCSQAVLLTGGPCRANPEILLELPECPKSAWLADREKCSCPIQHCTKWTNFSKCTP